MKVLSEARNFAKQIGNKNNHVISFDPSTSTLEESPHSYELLSVTPQSPQLLEQSGLLKVKGKGGGIKGG